MRKKVVCLFVCHTPWAPFVLHGRGPRPRSLSFWALDMCAPPCPHLLPRAAWERWVAGRPSLQCSAQRIVLRGAIWRTRKARILLVKIRQGYAWNETWLKSCLIFANLNYNLQTGGQWQCCLRSLVTSCPSSQKCSTHGSPGSVQLRTRPYAQQHCSTSSSSST